MPQLMQDETANTQSRCPDSIHSSKLKRCHECSDKCCHSIRSASPNRMLVNMHAFMQPMYSPEPALITMAQTNLSIVQPPESITIQHE